MRDRWVVDGASIAWLDRIRAIAEGCRMNMYELVERRRSWWATWAMKWCAWSRARVAPAAGRQLAAVGSEGTGDLERPARRIGPNGLLAVLAPVLAAEALGSRAAEASKHMGGRSAATEGCQVDASALAAQLLERCAKGGVEPEELRIACDALTIEKLRGLTRTIRENDHHADHPWNELTKANGTVPVTPQQLSAADKAFVEATKRYREAKGEVDRLVVGFYEAIGVAGEAYDPTVAHEYVPRFERGMSVYIARKREARRDRRRNRWRSGEGGFPLQRPVGAVEVPVSHRTNRGAR